MTKNGNKMSGIDFDEVLVAVGEKGRYQTIMFFILCIPATLPVAFLAFSNVFTNATPDHWCQPPPRFRNLNLSEADMKYLTIPFRTRGDGERVFSHCTMYDTNSSIYLNKVFGDDIRTISEYNLKISQTIDGFDSERTSDGKLFGDKNNNSYFSEHVRKSDDIRLSDHWKRRLEMLMENDSLETVSCRYGWVYDTTYYDYTLVTQLDLVCDNNWWPQTSTVLFYVGSLFGNIIFGWVADRWGRRRSMLWMIFLEVLLSIATCFANDYMTYLIFRALGGLFFPSLYQIPFILGIEMMGQSHRTFAGMLICMFFASSMSLLALLAYLLRDWFRLSIATSVPFLMLFSYYWIIPESPRWLVSQGRIDEAEEILQTIARYNGNKIPKRYLQTLHEGSSPITPLMSIKTIESKFNTKSLNGKIINNIMETNSKNNQIDSSIIKEEINKQENDAVDRKKSLSEQYDKLKVAELRKKFLFDETRIHTADDQCSLTKRPLTYPFLNSIEDNDRKRHVAFAKNDGSLRKNEEDIEKYRKESTNNKKYIVEEDKIIKEEVDNKSGDVMMKSICLQTDPVKPAEKEEATMLDIFRYPNIRKKFFLLTFDWIANAVVYNGLSYNATNLGVNDFLAFFIAAAIEIPSYMLAWWLMERWGRRWVLCLTLATGGMGCLFCMFVPEERVWITVTLAMIGKFGVAASFSVFYVFVGELFPTVLRSQAMGLASLLVSVGLLSFPYILQLSHYSRVLPLIILGILSLSGSIASVFLPETLNCPMPQSLEDGEKFGKDFKIFSMPKRRERRHSPDRRADVL